MDAHRHLLPMDTSADAEHRQGRTALLPIGSFEQHGPHLPSATDTVIACTIAREIAAQHPVQVLPPLTLSCSHEHEDWPGTVSISASTLLAVVRDVAASVRRSGAAGLVLVNGHGGNYALGNAVQEARGELALFPGPSDWAAARSAAGLESSADADMHAGEVETSILLHAHPELVGPGYADADHDAEDRPHLLTLGLRAYTASGVVGRPSLATARKGAAVLADLCASFGALPPLSPRGG